MQEGNCRVGENDSGLGDASGPRLLLFHQSDRQNPSASHKRPLLTLTQHTLLTHPPTAVCNTTLSCDRINGCLGRLTCICVARNSNSVGESRLTCNREGRRGACYIDTLSLGLALLLLGNYSIYKNSFLPTRLLIDSNY